MCLLQWSKLSKPLELFELMLYAQQPPGKNEDGWPGYEKHSSVKGHTHHLTCSLWLSQPILLCARLYYQHNPVQLSVGKLKLLGPNPGESKQNTSNILNQIASNADMIIISAITAAAREMKS